MRGSFWLFNALKVPLVFISHDVHFIRSLAQKVLHINSGQITTYSGGYDYYLEKTGTIENARAAVIAE